MERGLVPPGGPAACSKEAPPHTGDALVTHSQLSHTHCIWWDGILEESHSFAKSHWQVPLDHGGGAQGKAPQTFGRVEAVRSERKAVGRETGAT